MRKTSTKLWGNCGKVMGCAAYHLLSALLDYVGEQVYLCCALGFRYVTSCTNRKRRSPYKVPTLFFNFSSGDKRTGGGCSFSRE